MPQATSIKLGMVLMPAFQSHGKPAGRSTLGMITRGVCVTSLAEAKLDALKPIKLTTVTMTRMTTTTATMTAMMVRMTKTRKIKMAVTKMEEIKTEVTQMTVETKMMVTRTTTTMMTVSNRYKSLTLNKPSKQSRTLLTTARQRSQEHFSKWTGLLTTSKSS